MAGKLRATKPKTHASEAAIFGDDGATRVSITVELFSGAGVTAEQHREQLKSFSRDIAERLRYLPAADFGIDNTTVVFVKR